MISQKNKDRLPEIKQLRESGHTLEEIGKKFGVTRERIRQLCKLNNIVGFRRKKRIEIQCAVCPNKVIKAPSSYVRYCSLECRLKGTRVNPSKPIKDYSIEELREYNRKRTIAYHHKHKHEEWYKEYRRRNCKKYYETHKEYFNEYLRKRYSKNPERFRQKYKDYYEKNKEKMREYARNRYKLNRDKISARAKERYQINKLKKQNEDKPI